MIKKQDKNIKQQNNDEQQDEVVLSDGDRGYAAYIGNKIVELVSMLDVDDETKKGIFIMVSEMDLEIMENFVKMLEDLYVECAVQPVASEFDDEIERVEKKYDQKRTKLIKKSIKDFDQVLEKAKMMMAKSKIKNNN